MAKLLGALDAVEDRRTRFRTVAMACFPDGTEVEAEGVVEGEITTERRGSGGFGYDPVFAPEGGDGRKERHVTPGPGLPGPGQGDS